MKKFFTLLLISWIDTAGAQQPQLILPMGHSYGPTAAAISPNEKQIVTIGSEARLWDANTGLLLSELPYHYPTEGAAFSPDGKTFLTTSVNAFLWNAENGKHIRTFGEIKLVAAAVYSPDAESIYVVTTDSAIRKWNIADGQLQQEVRIPISPLDKPSFNTDRSLLLTIQDNHPLTTKDTVVAWDLSTGKPVKKYITPDVNSCGFSKDGSFIFAVTLFEIVLWDSRSGKMINRFAADDLTATGKGNIHAAAISPDNKTLAAGLSNGKIVLWDLVTHRIRMVLNNHSGKINTIEFTADAKKLISTSEDGTTKISHIQTGQMLAVFRGHALNRDQKAVYRKDRKQFFTVHADHSIKIWDAFTGVLIQTFYGHKHTIISARYNDNGDDIISLSEDNQGLVWEVSTQSIKYKIEEKDLTFAAFIPYTSKVMTFSRSGNAKVWDLGKSEAEYSTSWFTNGSFSDVNFRSDGKHVLVSNFVEGIICWDLESREIVFKAPPTVGRYASFSPDGSRMLFIFDFSHIGVWDAASGKRTAKLDLEGIDFEPPLVFSNDNKKIYSFWRSMDSISCWDAMTGRLLSRVDHYPEGVEFASYDSKSNKLLLPGNTEQSIYNFQKKTYYLSLAIDSVDYLTLIPGGYYQSSTGAAKLLHYTTGNLNVITFEQLDVKYNRPDKVLEELGNTDTALIRSYRKAWEKRIQKLGIDTTAFREGYSVPKADFVNRENIEYRQKSGTVILHINGMDSAYQLDRFNIWVNEVPVYGQRGISIRARNRNEFDTAITIRLSQGENRIETSITNVNGTESYRMPLQVNYSPAVKQKESTRFIGIGIDKFRQSEYNLQYSTKDIRDLSAKLKEKYGNDISIDTLFNENVTTANVKALKQKLQQTNENDKVIIAYSGHGMLSKDYDYYLSTYSVNFDKPEENGLPYDELESLLDSIPARKKLMLIDACHSGEVDKEDLILINKATDSLKLKKGFKPVAYKKEAHLGLKNSFELMQSLFVNVGKSTGATIISAAAGTQFALERNDLKNGVFTYAILEAMKTHSTMKISELKSIVGKRVEELTKGLQKPTSRNETIAVDWSLW
ncbi:MAG: caspase family protein [Chitinophagaceae bacterium]